MIWACLVCWGIVLSATVPAAWRVFSGHGVDHDPVKWGFFLVSLIMLAFNGRWLLAPDSEEVLFVLRLLSVVLALYVLALVGYYRR